MYSIVFWGMGHFTSGHGLPFTSKEVHVKGKRIIRRTNIWYIHVMIFCV